MTARFSIHLTFGDGVELSVGRLLFTQIGIKQACNVVVAEFMSPCDERPVTRNFVMLDRLRGTDHGGIEHFLVVDLASNLVGFLDEAVDGGTIRTPRLLAQLLEDRVEPCHLSFGLPQVIP
jgi:hypothetical protein